MIKNIADSQCFKHQHPLIAVKQGKQNDFLCLLCLIELTKIPNILPLNDIVLQQIQQNQEQFPRQMNDKETPNVNIEIVHRQKQKELCLAISFNKTGNIMVSGCNQDIKVWEFADNKLKGLTIIRGHTQNITTLYFCKESHKFFSGSQDKQIKLWIRGQNQEYKNAQVLQIHSKKVSCLLMNKKEDMLFTCGYDGVINVLIQLKGLWTVQEKLNFEDSIIYAISVNEASNMLVAIGDSSKILVWQMNEKENWVINQKIVLNKKDIGFRVCVVQDDLITLQPNQGNSLIIFQLNQEQKFEKTSQVKLTESTGDSDSFPQFYNRGQNILINKHSKNLYLLKKDDTNQFVIKNQIELPSSCSYGALTENLDYFIVWSCEEYIVYRLNNIY